MPAIVRWLDLYVHMRLELLVFNATVHFYIFMFDGFDTTVVHNLLNCWKSTLKPCISRFINKVSWPIIWF